jgi:hypothetical protein
VSRLALQQDFERLQAASMLIEMLTRRVLPDGRVLALRVQMFNVRLVVEVDMYTEAGWCYENLKSAAAAMARWDPDRDEEPSGWIKDPYSGRRRVTIFCGECGKPNGALEYR